jgi:superfamily I DNA and/or RNA helicase
VTVSILCFYRAQAREIRGLLDAPTYPGFEILKFEVIDAIDRIQGQESDLVFITFSRSRIHGRPGPRYGQWLQDLRRLNVACSRAHRALFLVGHRRTLEGLCSTDEAKSFYRHLFDLFKKRPDSFLSLSDSRRPRPEGGRRDRG